MKNNKSFLKKAGITVLIFATILFIGFLIANSFRTKKQDTIYEKVQETPAIVDLSAIPEYSGDLYVELNGNKPFFDASVLEAVPYEYYSPLDEAGRCGPAFAICCKETMPTIDERANISSIHPTGWQETKYPFISTGTLFNRSHLIARSLTAEEDNERNLITGTQQMNQDGMNHFELIATGYIDDTGNHVAYRVTPIFENDNAIASGVIMEAFSLEDNGDGVCFNVYVYNAQPYVKIDYKTGNSEVDEKALSERENNTDIESATYIINKNSMKFHSKDCGSLPKEENRIYTNKSYEELVSEGCTPHSDCVVVFSKSSAGNSQTEYTPETEASLKKEGSVKKGEEYCLHEEVAEYIHLYKELPPNYMTKGEARDKGWEGGNPQKVLGGNACIGGSKFGNKEKLLPEGVEYRECDVDYCDDGRGVCRLIYTADGKVYYTKDHYESFEELY